MRNIDKAYPKQYQQLDIDFDFEDGETEWVIYDDDKLEEIEENRNDNIRLVAENDINKKC